VQCLLCPKRGGAMKPTNIFSTVDNYKKYNPTKGGDNKKSIKKINTNTAANSSGIIGAEIGKM
jgi:hypothetical protein